MSGENIVTSIDIGSSKIRTIIAQFEDEKKTDFSVL